MASLARSAPVRASLPTGGSYVCGRCAHNRRRAAPAFLPESAIRRSPLRHFSRWRSAFCAPWVVAPSGIIEQSAVRANPLNKRRKGGKLLADELARGFVRQLAFCFIHLRFRVSYEDF